MFESSLLLRRTLLRAKAMKELSELTLLQLVQRKSSHTFYTRLCSLWPESVGFWTGGSIFGLHTFQHFFQFCSKYWTSDCILLLCEACARCISRTPTPTSSLNLRLPTSYNSMSLPSKCSLEFYFGWKFVIICMQLHLDVNKWTNRVHRKATLAWEKAIEVNNQRSLTLIQKPTGATTGNVGGALHGLWCIPYNLWQRVNPWFAEEWHAVVLFRGLPEKHCRYADHMLHISDKRLKKSISSLVAQLHFWSSSFPTANVS